MKTIAITLTIICCLFISNAYSQSFKAKFRAIPLEQMMSTAEAMQQKYDINLAKVDTLINYIFDLKSKTDDKQFLDAMDRNYKILKGFYDQDLARMDKEIRDVQLDLLEEVDNYNRRIKEESIKETTKESITKKYNTGVKVEVYGSSPIYELPSNESKTVCMASKGVVTIISMTNNKYYYVSYEDKKGYISVGWIK